MKTVKNSRVRNVSIIVFFAALIVIGLFVIINKEKKFDELSTRYSDLNAMYEQRDSLVNDFNNTFDEIEKNLTFVKNKRTQLSIGNEEGNPSQKETVVADIKLMNTMLEESSKKIDDLEKKLKDSGISIKSFKNKIALLTKNIEEQNASIEKFQADLKQRDEQIAQMDEQVASLTSDVQAKDNALVMKDDSLKMKSEIITKKDDEMNKAYFAMGTYKELKDNGVVKKDGGFLGLGRSQTIQPNLKDSSFTEVDKRSTDVFPIFSKKVEMISQHPDSSYRYIYDNDQIAYLKIETYGTMKSS